jgi:phage FluMu protein Com
MLAYDKIDLMCKFTDRKEIVYYDEKTSGTCNTKIYKVELYITCPLCKKLNKIRSIEDMDYLVEEFSKGNLLLQRLEE